MNLSTIIVDVVIVGDGPITRPLGPDNVFVCRVKILKIRPQSKREIGTQQISRKILFFANYLRWEKNSPDV